MQTPGEHFSQLLAEDWDFRMRDNPIRSGLALLTRWARSTLRNIPMEFLPARHNGRIRTIATHQVLRQLNLNSISLTAVAWHETCMPNG